MEESSRRKGRRRPRKRRIGEYMKYFWILPAIIILFLLPSFVGQEVDEVIPETEKTPVAGVGSGGSLRISLPAPITTLDPHQAVTESEMAIVSALTDGLFEYRGADGVRGAAAASWEFSSDGTTLEIALRPGLVFSDDTRCDAEAVAFNLRRMREVGPPVVAGAWLASIRDVEIVDNLTLHLHLWYPDPNLPFTLSRPQLGLVSPTAVEEMQEEFQLSPVGLGPFQVAWQAGIEGAGDRVYYAGEYMAEEGYEDPLLEETSVNLKVFEDYYRGRAHLDSITLATAPPEGDPSQLVALDYGLITRVAPGTRPPEGWSFLRRPRLDHHVLMYNLASPVLSDERVRRAISAAIDRTAAVESIFGGDAQLLDPGQVPLTGETRDLEDNGTDLERGRSLLADAGFLAPEASTNADSGGETQLIMITDPDETRVEVSHLLAEQIGYLGISVEVEVLERAEYYDRMRAGEYDLSYWVLVPEHVDPLAYTANLRSDSYWNVSQMWKNPDLRPLQNEIDDLLVAASRLDEDAERRALLARFAELVSENYIYTALWGTSVRGLVRDDVQGVRVPYGHDFDFFRTWIDNR